MARKSTGSRSAGRGKSKKKDMRRISVDFTDVEVRVHIPPGIYRAKVDVVTQEESTNKNDMLVWKFRTIDDDKKLNDKPLFYNTVLVPQSLWVLGALLDSLGVDRPDGPMDLELDDLVGLELELIVEEGEFEGKPRSEVIDFQPIKEGDDEDEEEVTPEVKDGDDDDSSYTEEEIMAMEADELDEVVNDEELEVKALKKLPKYRKRVLEALKEADLIETKKETSSDDDSDSLYTIEEVKAMDKEELIELIATEELDVNESKMKTLRRLQNAVIDALDEEELMEEEG